MENEQPGAVESSEQPEAEKTQPAAQQTPDSRLTKTKAEIGGRGGLEPTRYGDWEVKGIASDF